MYGFFLLIFVMLLIVTLCVATVGAYVLLNAENWQWQWTAFASGASTGAYVFLYALYYFLFKTKMTVSKTASDAAACAAHAARVCLCRGAQGFFQTCFYFGYSAMFCAALGCLCGACGYAGAAAFVRRIYRNIKCD